MARVFACSGGRGADRTEGRRHDDDDEGRGTGESRRDRDARATRHERRSHVPPTAPPARRRSSRRARRCSTRVRPRKRTRIGADALMEALILQGTDVLCSYPGGVILPIYDILGDYPEIRHVLVRHEQGGGHAADGYARASGKVGVCMGTSGPGATNLVTAIATASSTPSPMVAITGNVPNALIGKDAFQEIDITGITLPMTKHNYLVRNADDIPHVVAEAFYLAGTGRPGPVHIDITKDALQQETHAEHPSLDDVIAGLPGFRPTHRGPPEAAQARRPRDRRGQAPADPRRARRPHRRGAGTSSRRSPRRRRSRSRGRCSGSARSTRSIRSPTATWACTAGSTSTARSSRPTC